MFKSLGLSNCDYKKICNFSYFWCNLKRIVKILKNIAMVSEQQNKKQKKTHTQQHEKET
jgi:hypothetical protein